VIDPVQSDQGACKRKIPDGAINCAAVEIDCADVQDPVTSVVPRFYHLVRFALLESLKLHLLS